MADDLLFTPSGRGDAAKRIKQWVREMWRLADDEVVMVTELRCHEEGCPDVETVIALLGAQPTRTIKLAKPMSEVAADDIPTYSPR